MAYDWTGMRTRRVNALRVALSVATIGVLLGMNVYVYYHIYLEISSRSV